VVVFQPYKHYHAEAVEAATRTGCGDFNKSEFLDIIDTIRQQTFKTSTVKSAFRATGLIPYNPDIVISKLRRLQYPLLYNRYHYPYLSLVFLSQLLALKP